MKELEKSLDPQLWHACAGSMVQIPPVNSRVFYFPQGHAEHSQSIVDFGSLSHVAAFILCRVTAVQFLADSETDEVYAQIGLVPLPNNELEFDEELGVCELNGDKIEKPASFAKTLTQSDANNGGGFSVPRYCAETIFPRLDYSADPPVQTLVAKDIHGEIWKFRHIYRGTPRRHLLTTGWSSFVNQKKLVAGDSVVFLRAENGDLCIGIRRAKHGFGFGNGPESYSSGWISNSGVSVPRVTPSSGFSFYLKEDERHGMRKFQGKARAKPEDVVDAVAHAANGQPFEVVYYPRASTPEFCVKVSLVRASMRIHWQCGMRFKMAFETEDSSRISWFMGTINSLKVADPIHWPNSPWRLLQVTWDEPDLLQNVKRVNPWLIELVTSTPIIPLSPFSPPRKRLRLPTLDFPFHGQFQLPSLLVKPPGPRSPMCSPSDNSPASIQGARHSQIGISLSHLQMNSKVQSGMFPSSLQQFNQHSESSFSGCTMSNGNGSAGLLRIGKSDTISQKPDKIKRHQFLLFGQPILTEQQISSSCSADNLSQVLTKRKPSCQFSVELGTSDVLGLALDKKVSPERTSSTVSWSPSLYATDGEMEIGHCKVFMESDDVGRTLDLSVLSSYDELYGRLANMFEIERLDIFSRVLYQDATGAVKQTGDEPFSVFIKTAKKMTILMNQGSNDNVGMSWMTGMRNSENGIEASNKTGPLSMFA